MTFPMCVHNWLSLGTFRAPCFTLLVYVSYCDVVFCLINVEFFSMAAFCNNVFLVAYFTGQCNLFQFHSRSVSMVILELSFELWTFNSRCYSISWLTLVSGFNVEIFGFSLTFLFYICICFMSYKVIFQSFDLLDLCGSWPSIISC